MGHASEEQQARWLPDALTMRIIGSYAQTVSNETLSYSMINAIQAKYVSTVLPLIKKCLWSVLLNKSV